MQPLFNDYYSCNKECEGYAFFGTQAGNWCWCGKTEPPANRKRDDSECSSNCTADSSQKCGGPWRMSIYRREYAGNMRALWGQVTFYQCFTGSFRTALFNQYPKLSQWIFIGIFNLLFQCQILLKSNLWSTYPSFGNWSSVQITMATFLVLSLLLIYVTNDLAVGLLVRLTEEESVPLERVLKQLQRAECDMIIVSQSPPPGKILYLENFL